ncbi:hypothetical protein MKEN_01298500 [Mycena kentingensis (nom. inval.)]|nr:hypothetical protein MKEN_01298500 [Mycena kentingensis (nom. inval.)]
MATQEATLATLLATALADAEALKQGIAAARRRAEDAEAQLVALGMPREALHTLATPIVGAQDLDRISGAQPEQTRCVLRKLEEETRAVESERDESIARLQSVAAQWDLLESKLQAVGAQATIARRDFSESLGRDGRDRHTEFQNSPTHPHPFPHTPTQVHRPTNNAESEATPAPSKPARLCRGCGSPGRHRDGKCIEKWGPGPHGRGTVCDRCRKRIRRAERHGSIDASSSRELLSIASLEANEQAQEASSTSASDNSGMWAILPPIQVKVEVVEPDSMEA